MQKKARGRKGLSLAQVPSLIMTIVMIAIFLGAGYITIEAFQSSVDNTSQAYTGIGYVLTMMDNIASNLGILGTIFFVVLLISAVYLIWVRPKGQAQA